MSALPWPRIICNWYWSSHKCQGSHLNLSLTYISKGKPKPLMRTHFPIRHLELIWMKTAWSIIYFLLMVGGFSLQFITEQKWNLSQISIFIQVSMVFYSSGDPGRHISQNAAVPCSQARSVTDVCFHRCPREATWKAMYDTAVLGWEQDTLGNLVP